jgi:hypothetical protein
VSRVIAKSFKNNRAMKSRIYTNSLESSKEAGADQLFMTRLYMTRLCGPFLQPLLQQDFLCQNDLFSFIIAVFHYLTKFQIMIRGCATGEVCDMVSARGPHTSAVAKPHLAISSKPFIRNVPYNVSTDIMVIIRSEITVLIRSTYYTPP